VIFPESRCRTFVPFVLSRVFLKEIEAMMIKTVMGTLKGNKE
jgi:hypothetical protein